MRSKDIDYSSIEAYINTAFKDNTEAIEAIRAYVERPDVKDYLEKYKFLYPSFDKNNKIFLKYIPTKEEYLRFEQSCLIMDAASKKINRKKYGITEEDLKDFYGEDYKSSTKSKSNKPIAYLSNKKQNKAINISSKDVARQAELFKSLFDTDKECFIRIRCASNGQIYSYNVQDLKNPVKLHNILNAKRFTKEDLFYSIATYKTMLNGEEENIFSMHVVPVDIDYKKVKKLKNKTPMEIFNILDSEEFQRSIPIPTVVEISNQLRLLYKIECVGATKLSKNLVKRIARTFADRLVDYGADTPRLTDSARIKGSINTKNKDMVDIFFVENAPIYKVNELRDKWLDELPEWYPGWKAKPKKVTRFIPKDKDIFYTINTGRIQDFFRIANYFGKELDGRRFLCFLVRDHSKLRGDSDEEAENLMKEFNNSLAKPLRWRVIERDTRNVNKKQWLYKDITILDQLGLDKEDVSKIGLQELKYLTKEDKKLRKEKYDKEYNYLRYRNEEKLTKTEVRRRNEFIQIARLELQGISLRDIAIEIGKSVSTLSEKINKQYKIINYIEIKDDVVNGIFDDLRIEQLA